MSTSHPPVKVVVPESVLARLRAGDDLAFSLAVIPSGRWITTVRVQLWGPSLARTLLGRDLLVTPCAIAPIRLPDLRWDPADPSRR
jgi:hypothetical protein